MLLALALGLVAFAKFIWAGLIDSGGPIEYGGTRNASGQDASARGIASLIVFGLAMLIGFGAHWLWKQGHSVVWRGRDLDEELELLPVVLMLVYSVVSLMVIGVVVAGVVAGCRS